MDDILKEIDDEEDPNLDTDEDLFEELEDEDYDEGDDFIGEDEEID